MTAAAGLNRLRVALNTLRELGFKDLILTKTGGYLLDPSALVLRIAFPAAT